MKKVTIIIALLVATTFASKAQNAGAKKEFNNMLKAYFDTKNALAKDDVGLASAGAKNLAAHLESFPVKTLTETQQALWKAQAEEMKKAAMAIIPEKALKEQRKSFWTVSTAMIKLAKEFNMNTADVYVQYCPMAKKSWLNEVEAVQNPFYGSMMYDCGEVTATITKK